MIAHTRYNNFEYNCDPFSDINELGGQYLKIQWFLKAPAIDSALTLRSGITCVRLLNWSVINSANRVPEFYRGSGPRMSIRTDYKVLKDGNSCNGLVRFRSISLFLGHSLNICTVFEFSVDIGASNIFIVWFGTCGFYLGARSTVSSVQC